MTFLDGSCPTACLLFLTVILIRARQKITVQKKIMPNWIHFFTSHQPCWATAPVTFEIPVKIVRVCLVQSTLCRKELQHVKPMFYLANTAWNCSELGLLESSQTFQQAWPEVRLPQQKLPQPSLLWVIRGSASLGLALLNLKQGLIGS